MEAKSTDKTGKGKYDPDDILNIMVATDCHLGYEENDPIIGNDSFVTFEEILKKACDKGVDMLLLGGDLFHHNNPSQRALNECMSLLRKYCIGDKPVYIELLSDPALGFGSSATKTVNYLDDNINVSLPVFSIHGNHDDPSGQGQYSSMDTLATAGLVNYFGKWTNLSEVQIAPVLLKKGKTKLALYGLSHIKDDRLARLFIDGKVKFIRPSEETEDWFNIFVLHQNRTDRGRKRFICESYLPDFLDLVIWGHEHDCEIDPQKNVEKGFFVSQPGSSVATSLCEGEAKLKHIARFGVHGKEFSVKPFRLDTVRPFVWRSVHLKDVVVSTDIPEKKSEELSKYCQEKLEKMIIEAQDLLTGDKNQPKLPLIRLRCEYTDESQLFNVVKFGQKFYKRVANPNTEVLSLKKDFTARRMKAEGGQVDFDRLKELYEERTRGEEESFADCVNSLILEYFSDPAKENEKMIVLGVKEMNDAIERFVEKNETDVIDAIVKNRLKETKKKLLDMEVDRDNIQDVLIALREETNAGDAKMDHDLENKAKTVGRSNGNAANNGEGSDTDEYDAETITKTTKTSVRSNPAQIRLDNSDEDMAAAARPNTTTSARKTVVSDSDEDVLAKLSDEEPMAVPVRGRGRGRARGGRGRGRATAATATATASTTSTRTARSSSRAKSPRAAASWTPSSRGRKKEQLTFTSSICFDSDSD